MTQSLLGTPPGVAPGRWAQFNINRTQRWRSTRSSVARGKSKEVAAKIAALSSANDEENGEVDDGNLALSGRFNASPESVYRALTEYDGMQNMSASIVGCKRLWISSRVGRSVLRLQSRDRNLLWGTMKGDIIVEVTEDVESGRISFRAENSDERASFAVQGIWSINRVKDAAYLCDLRLELEVRPLRYVVTTSSLERWMSSQLPVVVRQVVARSIELDQVRLRAPRFLPALEATFGARIGGDNRREGRRDTNGRPLGYLGLSELPLPARDNGGDDENRKVQGDCISGRPDSVTNDAASTRSGSRGKARATSRLTGVFGEVPGTSVSAAQPAERWFTEDDDNLTRPGASEVHMRRFDTETTLHRRALGAVRIEAPPDVVYRMLTNFEGMSNFIPNLAFNERVELPFSQRNRPGRVRLRQVFLKCQLYHFLEARVTLDVVKKDDKGEVQFRVLNMGATGEILQGKWLVVPCPGTRSDDASTTSFSGSTSQATILKFAIEGRDLRRPSRRGFWLSSGPAYTDAAQDGPLPERAVFEEILLMLHSAREYMERTFKKERRATSKPYSDMEDFYASERFLTAEGVIDPVSELRARLTALGFGSDETMPRRAELRDLGAYDIEKAVVAAGGFEIVAKRLGWTKKRKKPRGYWSDLSNVERELLSFIEENKLEAGVMPSRPQLEELGRKDIAKSLAKHGGAGAIAQKLGLVSRRYRRRKARKSPQRLKNEI